VFRGIVATLAAGAACVAFAQQYPTRPMRLVIQFPPGGGVDVTARAIAQKLSEQLGQPMVVENRTGANGIVAAEAVAHAAPDGYTLFLPLDSTLTQLPGLYEKLPFDPVKDFAPVSQTTVGSYIFLTRPNAPFKTLPELVSWVKANPGKLNFGASTALTQLLSILLKQEAGADVTLVPYKGTAPQFQALMAGDVHVVADGIPFYIGMINSGKVVGLAITGTTRYPPVPNVPTVREAGFPRLEARSWFGVFAPAATPQPIIARLNGEIVKAIASPDLSKKLLDLGNTPVSSTPEQLAALLKEDLTRWTPILKASGIKLE
jgi:tripartite-type tricarboxylate transporter receptor subunit TctC